MQQEENEKKSRVHVFAASPKEQAVLRAILNDTFKKKVENIICEATVKKEEYPGRSVVRFENLFELYDTCISYLQAQSKERNGRTKVFYLTKLAMEFMNASVSNFRPEHSTIESDSIPLVKEVYPSLKAKINSASTFDYTLDEIREAARS